LFIEETKIFLSDHRVVGVFRIERNVGWSIESQFFVIFREGGQILSRLDEFAFFHSFCDVPVDEGAFGEHQIEFATDPRENLRDGGRIGEHGAGSGHRGEFASRDDDGGLVIDAAFDAGGTPVDELDGLFVLEGGHRRRDVFGGARSAVHEAARHIFAETRIAFGQLRRGFEDGTGEFRDCDGGIINLGGRQNRSMRRQKEMNSWKWDEVDLEFVHIDV